MSYKELIGFYKKYGVLEYVSDLLEWDLNVMMPKSSAWARIEEFKVLTAVRHSLLISEKMGELLEASEDLNEEQEAVIKEINWEYERAKKVPVQLASQLEEVRSQTTILWQEAKEKNDFSIVEKKLEEYINLQKKYAHAIDPSKDPYEVLLEEKESGIPLKDVEQYFSEIKKGVLDILAAAKNKQKIDLGTVDKKKQQIFLKKFLEELTFDFDEGRMDESVHPFSVWKGRITVRYDHGWYDTLTAAMHEAGHAFYELGLPKEHFGTPLGMFRSISVHESQSIFWEKMIGHNQEFWDYFFNKLKNAYGLTISKSELLAHMRSVNKSVFRLKSDSLTYPLHIILRFEMERDLINGNIAISDAPKIWNEKVKESIGIEPSNDAEGILQDMHWYGLNLGYFPTYTLGTMMAAQLFAAFKREVGMKTLQEGNFQSVKNWLGEKIYKHGKRYSTKELIRLATGKELGTEDYLALLKERYL